MNLGMRVFIGFFIIAVIGAYFFSQKYVGKTEIRYRLVGNHLIKAAEDKP